MSAYLWTMDALLAAMGGRAVGDVPQGVTGITIDSRSAAVSCSRIPPLSSAKS